MENKMVPSLNEQSAEREACAWATRHIGDSDFDQDWRWGVVWDLVAKSIRKELRVEREFLTLT